MTSALEKNKISTSWCENTLSKDVANIISSTKWLTEFIEVLKLFDDKNKGESIELNNINTLIKSIRNELSKVDFIENYQKIIWKLKIWDCFKWIKIDWILITFLLFKSENRFDIKLDFLERYLNSEDSNEEIFNYWVK